MSSEELCILASWFLSPITKKSVLVRGVTSYKISSHPVRDLLKSVFKASNA